MSLQKKDLRGGMLVRNRLTNFFGRIVGRRGKPVRPNNGHIKVETIYRTGRRAGQLRTRLWILAHITRPRSA